MANAEFDILEFRVVVKPSWTELYVRTGQASDGTLGVAGWWKKTIPLHEPALPALQDALVKMDFFNWDRGTPEA